jgi:hypothetical protein
MEIQLVGITIAVAGADASIRDEPKLITNLL